MKHLIYFTLITLFVLSGCAGPNQQRISELEKENIDLKDKIKNIEVEKQQQLDSIKSEKDKLEKAKKELERSLQSEISKYQAKLQVNERGLVITFISEIFFNSGKDTLNEEGKQALEKVAEVLNTGDIKESLIAIEGHTDNEPIKYSGWESNWQLSSARSLSVLKFLVDECRIEPYRLSANGYGEFRPVVPNSSEENKQKNRRVEIIVLPSNIIKQSK